jgi:diaminopimelate decarboxylase
VIGKDRELFEVKPGEFVAIADSGAYGFSMASAYNEHEMPTEFFWENGELKSVKASPAITASKLAPEAHAAT